MLSRLILVHIIQYTLCNTCSTGRNRNTNYNNIGIIVYSINIIYRDRICIRKYNIHCIYFPFKKKTTEKS